MNNLKQKIIRKKDDRLLEKKTSHQNTENKIKLLVDYKLFFFFFKKATIHSHDMQRNCEIEKYMSLKINKFIQRTKQFF